MKSQLSIALLASFILLCGLFELSGQQAGNIDTSFNSIDQGFGLGDGASETILSSIVQPDGKVLIVGGFYSFDSVERNRIARLNADGSLDTTFNPGTGANDWILSMALQPDGKVLIGGDFTSYDGIGRNRIARLNADGSLDNTFDPGTGANDYVLSIAPQPDGKILIGGLFYSYNGSGLLFLARLNDDGSLDNTFNAGMGGPDYYVSSIALQPDGKILIGGGFTSYNGIVRNRIARLNADGNLDITFNPGTGANDNVNSVANQPDGKILIGGAFTSYNGIVRNRIARLNVDGSLDITFNPGTGANDIVYSLALQPDGKLLIGGGFTSYAISGRNRIARLNADGSLDSTFNPETGANDFIETIALQPDGKVLIGGGFTSYNGIERNRIARLNADGSIDIAFNSGTGSNRRIYSIALQPDGKVLIGGNFTAYNGIVRNRIARLNANGSLDSTFNPGMGADDYVSSIALQPDGKILIGGAFTLYNGIGRSYVARLNADGSVDSTFNPTMGANYYVSSMALQPDGKVLIGGIFTSYNGIARSRIARLNTDGSLDNTFDPGMGADDWVSSIALQPDGKILIGGGFDLYNVIGLSAIVRLNADGSVDNSFNPGTWTNDWVTSIVLQPDGKILLGGAFNLYNVNGRDRIARLNADGSLDNTFNPGMGADDGVMSIALQADGKILIVGRFTVYNGFGCNYIARLNANGSFDNTFSPGTGANDFIETIALQTDDKVLIGGQFTSYDGTGRNRIARIYGTDQDVSTLPTLYPKFPYHIYPNPTLDRLLVESPEDSEIMLFDLHGKCIHQRSSSATKEVFDLSELAQGVYILQISSKGGIHRERVVKQ